MHSNIKKISQPNVPAHHTLLNKFAEKGGRKMSKPGLYRLCCEAEKAFQTHKGELGASELPIPKNFVSNIGNVCKTVKLP